MRCAAAGTGLPGWRTGTPGRTPCSPLTGLVSASAPTSPPSAAGARLAARVHPGLTSRRQAHEGRSRSLTMVRFVLGLAALVPLAIPVAAEESPRTIKVLFLGDDGHHHPAERYRQIE